MHLLAQRVPWLRSHLSEGPGEREAELHHGHHPLGGEPVGAGRGEDAGAGDVQPLRLHLQPGSVQVVRPAGGAEPRSAKVGHRQTPPAARQTPLAAAAHREGGEEAEGRRLLTARIRFVVFLFSSIYNLLNIYWKFLWNHVF